MTEDKSAINTLYEKSIDHVFDRLYEVLRFAAYGLAGITIMIIGFLTSYFNILYQFEKLGIFSIGAIASGGIVLFLIGLALIYDSKNKSIRLHRVTTSKIPTHSTIKTTSPIEQAIADMINDLIAERQDERKKNHDHNPLNQSSEEEIKTLQ